MMPQEMPQEIDADPHSHALLVAPSVTETSTKQAGRTLLKAFEPMGSFEPRDSYAVTALGDIIDRSVHAAAARFSFSLSPAAVLNSYFDWAIHMAFSPGKWVQLADKSMRKCARFSAFCCQISLAPQNAKLCIEPLEQDNRFKGEGWQTWPYLQLSQQFLLTQQWLHNAVTGVRGVTPHHERLLQFVTRQMLDTLSPTNFVLTNPDIFRRTVETGGLNLMKGAQNMFEDWMRAASGKKPIGTEGFEVGRTIAATPGQVVFRNSLIELIQYEPSTKNVHAEPILIVPAWIMKYYILDLSPGNSLVKFLVDRGFTVFMISWKNPGPQDRDLHLDDYRTHGVQAALDAIHQRLPDAKIHAAGYCLGGTLLSIAAAAMSRDGDHRLASMTLLAAQTDFTEPGELGLFIDESQLAFLDDVMWEQGYLDAKQMSGAFQLLRSNDLVWSRAIREYLMGDRTPMSDLMAWNADSTRMPYRMHSEYLRKLFLNNDLAEGRYVAGDRPVALVDIHVPIFVVGTRTDHVAPWRSTYKIHLQVDTEVTYVLTSGGHNAGIVSEPGHRGRQFQMATSMPDEAYMDPDSYLQIAPLQEGSWWMRWVEWLAERSGPQTALPVAIPDDAKRTLPPAPGMYVKGE
jgi:polyhydroxyalkanoate synthase